MKYSTGITLIEVLVAILLFAGGILGVAALQAQSLRIAANSDSLGIAVEQANNMMDRMLANPQGIDDGHYNNISGTGSDPACGTNCSTSQLATLDAYQWNTNNATLMLGGAGTVAQVAGTDLYRITVTWTERGKTSNENKSYDIAFLPYQP